MTNSEFNRALCEAKTPIPVREFFAVEPATIRKLTVAESEQFRGRAAVTELAGASQLYTGKVFHVDKINLNSRIYPRAVMQENINRLKPLLESGQLIGVSGHPSDMEEYSGDPAQIAVKWHDLSIAADGAGMGTFSVIPTEAGKNLQVCLNAKLGAIGFSTYGFGQGAEPTDTERGKYGLGEDQPATVMLPGYHLAAIDCVRGPSVVDAAVTNYPEHVLNPAGGAVQERADGKSLAEACSSGLHWREFGRCGHVVSECKCESDDKHGVYADKVCPKCAGNPAQADGMSKEEFKAAIKESASNRVPVTEAREPLAKKYTQYLQGKNSFEPAGPIKLSSELSRDAFNIIPTWSGVRFERHIIQNDQAYRFEGSPADMVLQEIDAFWKKKEEYAKFGVMHRRGIVVHGPPGTGKSIGIDQAVEMVTAAGDVAFYAENIEALKEGLQAFREVEPDRKVLVVLEDAEKYIGHQERPMLQLLDGADSIEGVLYIASTNYLNRFPERLMRSRRFDRKVFVGPPSTAGRKAYLQNKLSKTVSAEEIERLSKETDGLSYGDLATLITDAFILEENVDAVIARLKGVQAQGARLKEQSGHKPVSEHQENKPPRETEMDIKTLSELKDKAPAIHAEHMAAVNSEKGRADALDIANKKIRDSVNPVLKALKEVAGIEFPEREVLPAEFAERQRTLETKITSLETEKAGLLAEKSTLAAKVAELQAAIDTKERASKVWATAKPLLKDNAYAEPLRDALREKCAADATFDSAKVEAFIDAECVKYDRISGGKSKGKAEAKGGAKPAGGQGRNVSDEELDALEDVGESELGEVEPAAELASAFGGRRRVEKRPTRSAPAKSTEEDEL